MENKIFGFKIEDIGKEVIVALIVAGILGLFSMLPATKPYFIKFLYFVLKYNEYLLLFLISIILFFIFKKIYKLQESLNSLNQQINNVEKAQAPATTQLQKFKELKTDIVWIKKRL